MRRSRLEITVFVVAFAHAAVAQTTTADTAITPKTLFRLSLQEAAPLVGADGHQFVARTIYMFPRRISFGGVSTILGGVEFFTMPEAILPGICEIDVVDVKFKPKQAIVGSLTSGDEPYEVVGRNEQRVFAVAGKLEGPANWDGADKRDAEENCHHVKIATDQFSYNGADNVFTADSPDVAQVGARIFDAIIRAAIDDNKLQFTLTCVGDARFCAKPRAELAKMDVHRFESINLRDCGALNQTCYRISGEDYSGRWRLEVAISSGPVGVEKDNILSVQFGKWRHPIY